MRKRRHSRSHAFLKGRKTRLFQSRTRTDFHGCPDQPAFPRSEVNLLEEEASQANGTGSNQLPVQCSINSNSQLSRDNTGNVYDTADVDCVVLHFL